MSSTRLAPAVDAFAPDPNLPPLEPGDRLTRAEFERRDQATAGNRKFELIGGIVYVASPTRIKHGEPHSLINTVVGTYAVATPGVRTATDATVRMSEDDEVRPDVLLWIDGPDGRARVDTDGYLTGAPELVVEVASSSASYDLHQKADLYRRQGCAEYLVFVVRSRELHWLGLRDGAYEPLPTDAAGIIRSRIVPGLWLDGPAFVAGDGARVLAMLGAGLAHPEHSAFVARLCAGRQGAHP